MALYFEPVRKWRNCLKSLSFLEQIEFGIRVNKCSKSIFTVTPFVGKKELTKDSESPFILKPF